MPTKPTGAPELRNDRWYARIVVARKRLRIEMTTCRPEDVEKAAERAMLLSGLVRRLKKAGHHDVVLSFLEGAASRDGDALEAVLTAADRLIAGEAAPPIATTITVRELGEQWTKGELHQRWPDHVKLKKSADDDRERLELYVYPLIGAVPIPDVTIAHADAVMSALPKRLARSTRRHVAQVLSRLLNLAAYPCRIIPSSPLPRGFLPKPGARKALSYLYPDEDAKLLGALDVPLCYRVFYGFLAREGMRRGEAAALTWRELDLKRGAVSLDENKTDDPRAWALDPGAARALERWRQLRRPKRSERVFIDDEGRSIVTDDGKGVPRFHRHLEAAEVDRAELFERTATRIPIRVHDLRATFITVSLACGRTETWVADRTGHKSSAMINRYRRAARRFAELGVGDLLPLDQAIPELAPRPSPEPPEPSPEPDRRTDHSPDLGPESGGSSAPRSAPNRSSVVASGSARRRDATDSRGRTRTGTPFRTADFESAISPAEPSRTVATGLHSSALATDRDGGVTSRALGSLPAGADAGAVRLAFIRRLADSIAELAAAGDVAAARIAHEALGRVLSVGEGDGGAEVIDLGERRGR